jgi:hypothetical protein
MFTRTFSVIIVIGWLVAMAWLVHHDILPAWTARDVPKYDLGDWLTEDLLQTQARIENRQGKRIGTVWTEYTRSPERLTRRDILWLEDMLLPRLRIESQADFTPEGDLDEINLRVYGTGEYIALKGENYSGSMAFDLTVGRRSQLFKIDAGSVGTVGDTIRPFATLPNIEVGQSWRMHAINPLAVMSGMGAKLIPMLVKVTRKEQVLRQGAAVECFVVETDRARAWVDERGVVLRQEVDLPIGGRISVVDEPFDAAARDAAVGEWLPSGDE